MLRSKQETKLKFHLTDHKSSPTLQEKVTRDKIAQKEMLDEKDRSKYSRPASICNVSLFPRNKQLTYPPITKHLNEEMSFATLGAELERIKMEMHQNCQEILANCELMERNIARQQGVIKQTKKNRYKSSHSYKTPVRNRNF